MSEVLGALILGAMGWTALEFIGRPIRSFLDLRREIRKQTLFLANVPVPMPGMDVDVYDSAVKQSTAAHQTYRDLGTRAMAFGESELLASYLLRCVRIDPIAAGAALIGLSNTHDYGEQRATFRTEVARALRFK